MTLLLLCLLAFDLQPSLEPAGTRGTWTSPPSQAEFEAASEGSHVLWFSPERAKVLVRKLEEGRSAQEEVDLLRQKVAVQASLMESMRRETEAWKSAAEASDAALARVEEEMQSLALESVRAERKARRRFWWGIGTGAAGGYLLSD